MKNFDAGELDDGDLNDCGELNDEKEFHTRLKDDESKSVQLTQPPPPYNMLPLCNDPGLDSGSDLSRPGSSKRHVDSPEISVGSPIVRTNNETRNHDPATRRTSTPENGSPIKETNTVPILESPQKSLKRRKVKVQKLPSLEDEAVRKLPTLSCEP